MKKLMLLVSLVAGMMSQAANNVIGYVLTDSKVPVVNAVVSDGYSVVTTNTVGYYEMPYDIRAKFVFVSVPAGYDFPADATGTPKIWQEIDHKATSQRYDFALKPQADGGKADSAHVLLVIGDPQVYDTYGLWRFRNETVEDIKTLKASYPQGTEFVTLIVGDLVWDKYKYFPNQKANMEETGIPYFIAIGNHDHNRSAPQQETQAIQDSVASLLFEAKFGPTYYSFNRGNVHYVILDNVYYCGYDGGSKSYDCEVTQKQLDWVAKDIAQLAVGTQVVFAMHINAVNMYKTRVYLQDLVKPLGTTCYIMSGHVHANEVKVFAADFIEHNVAAAQGSYWSCDWCSDGSPNGYKVFEMSPTGITKDYYKGTGLSADFRIRTYPVNSINAGNSKQDRVLANIWDWDKNCKVKILENGVEKNMPNFEGSDPDVFDLMFKEGDTRPNYPGSEGGTEADRNPGSKKHNHMFSYKPTATNSDLTVVFTDRYGNVTTAPILRHMMVASFDTIGQDWVYEQDFDCLPHYPNYFTSAKVARGTWVAGHTPMGWYCSTSKGVMPGEGEVTWGGYEYLHINNGSEYNSWLFSYGAGNPSVATENDPERALGTLNTINDKRISYGLLIENNTGEVITSLDITYTGEVWRVGADNTVKETLQFSYAILNDTEYQQIRDREKWLGEINGTAVPELAFTTPNTLTAKQTSTTSAAIDGNNANNRAQVKGTIQLTLQPGEVVMLRWEDNLVDTKSNDQGIAIDDVSVVAHCDATAMEIPTYLHRNETRTILQDGQVVIQTERKRYSMNGATIQ